MWNRGTERLHAAKPFTKKKNPDTDDEGQVIKGKCFLAHSLIISRLQTHLSAEGFFFCIRVYAEVCMCIHLLSDHLYMCVFYGGGGIYVNTRVCVCMCKLYVGEDFMCLGFTTSWVNSYVFA